MVGFGHPFAGVFGSRKPRGNYKSYISTLALIHVLLFTPAEVSARGRMMEPPQRSSLWSRGFDSPKNNDDSGLNCGGPWVQHGINGGRCGVCGDRYDVLPHDNEPGGKYANGIIANTYSTNDSSILVLIDIQSFQGGYFEFRICPHNNVHKSVAQECLDRHQLRVWDLVNKEPKYRYYPESLGPQQLRVELPRGMTCTQCVLQWKWHTAKDWGRCADGSSKLGCGPQEEFFNCADIAIEPVADYNVDLNRADAPLPSEGPRPAIETDGQVLNFEVGFKPYGQNLRQELKAPISFLPLDVLNAGNIGPVLPKFDFYDPNVPVPSPGPTVASVETVSSSQSIDTLIVNEPVAREGKQVGSVVLEFNGNANPAPTDVAPTEMIGSTAKTSKTVDIIMPTEQPSVANPGMASPTDVSSADSLINLPADIPADPLQNVVMPITDPMTNMQIDNTYLSSNTPTDIPNGNPLTNMPIDTVGTDPLPTDITNSIPSINTAIDTLNMASGMNDLTNVDPGIMDIVNAMQAVAASAIPQTDTATDLAPSAATPTDTPTAPVDLAAARQQLANNDQLLNAVASSFVPGETAQANDLRGGNVNVGNVDAVGPAEMPTDFSVGGSVAPLMDASGFESAGANDVNNKPIQQAVMEKPQDAGGIVIPNIGFGDINVMVGLGAWPHIGNQPDPTQWIGPDPFHNDNTVAGMNQPGEVTGAVSDTNVAPSVSPAGDLPALTSQGSIQGPEVLVRRRRQAGPPPPHGRVPAADPGPKGTINFGSLIGDSFSMGGSQTQTSFFSPNDFNSGAATGMDMLGEALIEPGTANAPSAIGRGVAQPQPRADPGHMPQNTVFEPMFIDNMLPGPKDMHSSAEAAMAPVETGVPYINPLIPRPPRQSASELERAIARAPVISSAISDTGKTLDPSALVGASYIPELNEGRSNQAETSTAARHSSMVIKDEMAGRKFGKSQEYLSATSGTSVVDDRSNTMAEMMSATSKFVGYRPTAEEILSGQGTMYHPTQNIDSTHEEAVGASPTDSANVVPSILNSIIGGGGQPSDSSLDPAVQKARQDIIRQLGEAMGIGKRNRAQQQNSNSQPTAASITDPTLSTLLAFTSGGQGLSLVGSAEQAPPSTNAHTQTGMNEVPAATVQLNPMGNAPKTDGAAGTGVDMTGNVNIGTLMGMQGRLAESSLKNNPAPVPKSPSPSPPSPSVNQPALKPSEAPVSSNPSPSGANEAANVLPTSSVLSASDILGAVGGKTRDILGIPGMTVQEMLAILNMGQTSQAAVKPASPPIKPATPPETANLKTSTKSKSTTGSVHADFGMESDMFGQTPSLAQAAHQKAPDMSTIGGKLKGGLMNEMGSRSSGQLTLEKTLGSLKKTDTSSLKQLMMGKNNIGQSSMVIQGLSRPGFNRAGTTSYFSDKMAPPMTTVLAEMATTDPVAVERINKGKPVNSNTLTDTTAQGTGFNKNVVDPNTATSGQDSGITVTEQEIRALLEAQIMADMGKASKNALLSGGMDMGNTVQQASNTQTGTGGQDIGLTLTEQDINALMKAQNMINVDKQSPPNAAPAMDIGTQNQQSLTSKTSNPAGQDLGAAITEQDILALIKAQNVDMMGQQASANTQSSTVNMATKDQQSLNSKSPDPTGQDMGAAITQEDILALMKAQNMGNMGQQASANTGSGNLDVGNQMMFGLLGMGPGMVDPTMFDAMFGPTNQLDQAGPNNANALSPAVDLQAEAKLNAIAKTMSGSDVSGNINQIDQIPPSKTAKVDTTVQTGSQSATVQVVDPAVDSNTLNPNAQLDFGQEGTISLADLLSGAFGFVNSGPDAADPSMASTGGQSAAYETQPQSTAGDIKEIAISSTAQKPGSQANMNTDFTPLGNVGAGSEFESYLSQGTGQEELIWDAVNMVWVPAVQPTPTTLLPTSQNTQMITSMQTQNMKTTKTGTTGIGSTRTTMGLDMFGTSPAPYDMFDAKPTSNFGLGPQGQEKQKTTKAGTTGIGSTRTTMGLDMFGTSPAPYDMFDAKPTSNFGLGPQGPEKQFSGEKLPESFTEKSKAVDTQTVDPKPTKTTSPVATTTTQATKAPVSKTTKLVTTTTAPIVSTLDPVVEAERRRLEEILNRQKAELRKLQQQKREQERQLMLEKQRIEYEQRQFLLQQQQLEIEKQKKVQLEQQMLLEKKKRELTKKKEEMRLKKLREEEFTRQRQAEMEKKKQLEIQKAREAELARQLEAERAKQAELQRQQELIKQQEAKLAEKKKAEALARANAAAAAAEAEANRQAAAQAAEQTTMKPMIENQQGINQISDKPRSDSVPSFTPLGSVGGSKSSVSPDAATVEAWTAYLMAQQGETGAVANSPKIIVPNPVVQSAQTIPAQAQPTAVDAQTLQAWQAALAQRNMYQQMMPVGPGTIPQLVPGQFPGMVQQIPGMVQPVPGMVLPQMPMVPGTLPSGAGILGAWSGMLNKQVPQTTPAPTTTTTTTTTTPAPTTTQKPKVPIRPDPETRNFVREMFLKNMGPGNDPLSILVGLTPELLMKSGVNPRIANSGDLSIIVPAVERTLGISLQPVQVSPSGRVRQRPHPAMGGPEGPAGRRGGPPRKTPRDRARERREFMLQQRMMNEMMQALGLGPEPLEPGDPGYKPPRGSARLGQAGAGMGGAMGGGMGAGMVGGMGGAMGAGMGGAGNSMSQLQSQMEMLGL